MTIEQNFIIFALITKTKFINQIPDGHDVLTPFEVKFLKIPLDPTNQINSTTSQNSSFFEDYPILKQHFLFCPTLDITRPYPSAHSVNDYSPDFCWNCRWRLPFEKIGYGDACVVLVQGYLNTISNNLDFLTYFVKKSVLNPNLRYQGRGLNEKGCPGNEVECELIVWHQKELIQCKAESEFQIIIKSSDDLQQLQDTPNSLSEFTSVVWRRGTIPIFWKTLQDNKIKQVHVITDPSPNITQQYFEGLKQRFQISNFFIISLIENIDSEKDLNDNYFSILDSISNDSLTFNKIYHNLNETMKDLASDPNLLKNKLFDLFTPIIEKCGMNQGKILKAPTGILGMNSSGNFFNPFFGPYNFSHLNHSQSVSFDNHFSPLSSPNISKSPSDCSDSNDFSSLPESQKQSALCRFNCVDSIDRTNIATCFFAIAFLRYIHISDIEKWEEALSKIFIESGNVLSELYLNSNTVKSQILKSVFSQSSTTEKLCHSVSDTFTSIYRRTTATDNSILAWTTIPESNKTDEAIDPLELILISEDDSDSKILRKKSCAISKTGIFELCIKLPQLMLPTEISLSLVPGFLFKFSVWGGMNEHEKHPILENIFVPYVFTTTTVSYSLSHLYELGVDLPNGIEFYNPSRILWILYEPINNNEYFIGNISLRGMIKEKYTILHKKSEILSSQPTKDCLNRYNLMVKNLMQNPNSLDDLIKTEVFRIKNKIQQSFTNELFISKGINPWNFVITSRNDSFKCPFCSDYLSNDYSFVFPLKQFPSLFDPNSFTSSSTQQCVTMICSKCHDIVKQSSNFITELVQSYEQDIDRSEICISHPNYSFPQINMNYELSTPPHSFFLDFPSSSEGDPNSLLNKGGGYFKVNSGVSNFTLLLSGYSHVKFLYIQTDSSFTVSCNEYNLTANSKIINEFSTAVLFFPSSLNQIKNNTNPIILRNEYHPENEIIKGGNPKIQNAIKFVINNDQPMIIKRIYVVGIFSTPPASFPSQNEPLPNFITLDSPIRNQQQYSPNNRACRCVLYQCTKPKFIVFTDSPNITEKPHSVLLGLYIQNQSNSSFSLGKMYHFIIPRSKLNKIVFPLVDSVMTCLIVVFYIDRTPLLTQNPFIISVL